MNSFFTARSSVVERSLSHPCTAFTLVSLVMNIITLYQRMQSYKCRHKFKYITVKASFSSFYFSCLQFTYNKRNNIIMCKRDFNIYSFTNSHNTTFSLFGNWMQQEEACLAMQNFKILNLITCMIMHTKLILCIIMLVQFLCRCLL